MSEKKVQIAYKSGSVFTAWFSKFTAIQKYGELKGIEWELSPRESTRVYYLGVDNIESILMIDEREA